MELICADLDAEHIALDDVVGALGAAQWDTPTPSPGWSVRDQISHLMFFDRRALMALVDPEAFAADTAVLMQPAAVDPSVVPGREMSPAQLLEVWRADRAALLRVARTVDPSTRVPWYGPSMAAKSFITARLMETWAHGQDIVDAVGAHREPSARLRHVAHIGVRARPFSYRINRVDVPDQDVHVLLDAPGGGAWEWAAPADRAEPATDAVRGDAEEFCLVVTQRRNLADTDLQLTGAVAAQWMSFAQAFAGAPGRGRQPGQFRAPGVDV
jgi:uncharacterized protein (TIGR03084 family)